ncbi:phage/plasmid replication protein, II/X family [Zooshikella ganghwensis]|uniref:phage/plasmid replication protein, II/X family n=1 Tax=Zooshikella ganghwensis TaxID=202772 RepID=UPI0003F97BF3|nr:phage/plasmid replication protein, II/X family [Zooshikella ganghwensis]
MIDWITAEVPCLHTPLPSDVLIKANASGEIDWQTRCHISIRGSYESQILVKSVGGDGSGQATHLLIDGNPSKFLQGHNAFGSNDVLGLVWETIKIIKEHFNEHHLQFDELAIRSGRYEIRRIDITESFSLGSLANVRAWLRAAEFQSKTRHGRPSGKGNTLYWGKSSRRWALKAYAKFDELTANRKHHLPEEERFNRVKKWAEDKLRVELVMRGKELTSREIKQAASLTAECIENLYTDYLGRLEMRNNVTLTSEEIMKLPRAVQSSYMLWQQGAHLREILPASTFRRHNKLLKAFGIDLDLPVKKPDTSNVVPLIRVLEAKPAGVPDWAYKEKLVFQG